jgi:cytochrome c553
MKRHILTTLAVIALSSAATMVSAADAAAGKTKAASCAGCHGAKGISAVPTYPNIAGQKAAYTVKQLKAFKSGARKDPIMNGMAKPLSDADMANIAAYYAGLK